MAKREKTERIEKGGYRVSITPDHRERGGVIYSSYRIRYTIDGQRVTKTAATLKEARKEASAIIAQLKAKGGAVATYSPAEVAVIELAIETCTKAGVKLSKAVMEYAEAIQHLPAGVSLVEAVRQFKVLKAKQEYDPINIREVIKLFLQELKERNESGSISALHYGNRKRWLKRVADYFNAPIGDISSTDIEGFLRGLKGGPMTRNHHRSAVVGLFRYAQRKKFISREGRTEADYSLRETEAPTAILAYSPEQARHIIENIDKRWRAYAALSLFAGIRREELFRMSWGEVKADHIEVTAAKSKTGLRRIVPIPANLRAWLDTITSKDGMVCPTFGNEQTRSATIGYYLRAVAKSGGFPVVKNGLRHSFISYRVAQIKNLPQTAYEAGNTPEVITTHYNKVATEQEAERFFSIYPAAEPAA